MDSPSLTSLHTFGSGLLPAPPAPVRPLPARRAPPLARRLRAGCCACAVYLRDHLADFCDNTSVHGFKYLQETTRPWYERALWLLGLALSMVWCAALVVQTWSRWRASPVIVALDETQRPVWQIPFPAVTVCPANKFRASLFNFSAVHRNLFLGTNATSLHEERLFLDLYLLCDKKEFQHPDDCFRDKTTVDNIEKFAPQIKDTVISAEFRRKELHTYYDFQPLLTEEGLCFSFNMLQGSLLFPSGTFHRARRYLQYPRLSAQWTPSGGYSASAGRGAYPFRATASGAGSGLTFVLRARARDLHLDTHCRNALEGYKIQLHSPAEFPRPAERSQRVPLGGVAALRVAPAEIAADADVRGGYSAQQRRCFFPDERRLATFLLYSQSNCELECLANLTLRSCRCVPFYMPRLENTTVCGTSGKIVNCVMEAEEAFQDVDFRTAAAEAPGAEGPARTPRGERDRCRCLQTCAHLSYHSDASSFEAPAAAAAAFLLDGEDREFTTTVSINFKDTYFIPTRRIEMFGTIDFLANCGGLLGLGLGVSVVSVVELIYWLLVRPCCLKIRPQPSP